MGRLAGYLAGSLLVLLAMAWADSAAVTPADLRAAGLKAKADWLPYTQWDAEYRAYFQRHTHDSRLTLKPSAIVMHYTVAPTLQATWDSFAHGAIYNDGDVGRVFGHLSSHFIIDRDGTVYCCIPTNRRCRGAYGVNHVAISIEMVGHDEAAVLRDPALMQASFKLVDCLCQRYHINVSHVWGHYQVAEGRSAVPDYLDYGDHRWPDGYPPSDWRTDPGKGYMQLLRQHLQAKGG